MVATLPLRHWSNSFSLILSKRNQAFFFVLSILLSLLRPFEAISQVDFVKHYTIKDGLPSMSVRQVFKDSQGYLWIGTDAGLCRYDGKTFRIFLAREGMTASNIWCIAEGENGVMWFGSFADGLYKYDGTAFKHFTVHEGLVSDNVRKLYYSKRHQCLLIGTNNGLAVMKGEKFIRLKVPRENPVKHANPGGDIIGIHEFGDSILFTSYKTMPKIYLPKKDTLIYFKDSTFYLNYWPTDYFYIRKNADSIFGYAREGVSIFRKNKPVLVKRDMGQVFDITPDGAGNLWMAVWSYIGLTGPGGLFRYDGKTITNESSRYGITDQETWSLFYDREQHLLWVCTLNDGLYCIPFTGFSSYPAAFFGSANLVISDIISDKYQHLWLATSDRLITLLPDRKYNIIDNLEVDRLLKKAVLNFPETDNRWLKFRSDANSVLHKKPGRLMDYRSFTFLPGGELAASLMHGILRINVQTNTLSVNYTFGNGDLACINDTLITSAWANTSLYKIGNGKLLFIGDAEQDHGIFHFKGYADINNSSSSSPLEKPIVNNGIIWYSSPLGGIFNSTGAAITHLNSLDSTLPRNVTFHTFDRSNHIIFGTNTGEVYIGKATPKYIQVLYRITDKEGIKGNTIQWIESDNYGFLWFATNQALHRLNLERLLKTGKISINILDEEEGYNALNSKTGYADKMGKLWIGGNDHQLVCLDTRTLQLRPKPHLRVVLTSLMVNDSIFPNTYCDSLRASTKVPAGEFCLGPDENNVALTFDVINYLNPGKDVFRYRLKGLNEKWSKWTASRKVVFTNLSPGRYTLQVESRNLNFNTATRPLSVSFTVYAHWFEYWYSKAGMIVAGIILIILILKLRVAQVRKQEREKARIQQRLASLEISALQSQMNPHFIFNAINAIQSFVLKNNVDEALRYLSYFSKIVRASLENVTKRVISLSKAIEFTESYLRIEDMRFPQKFTYSIQIEAGLDPISLLIPPMLIQPFAENAIRHGIMHRKTGGKLAIEFARISDKVLRCTVSDNGIGRKRSREIEGPQHDPDRQHSSSITETRLRLLNENKREPLYKVVYTDLTNDQGQPAGLRVDIYMPVEDALLHSEE